MLSFVSNIDLEKIINILLEPSVTLTLGIYHLSPYFLSDIVMP